LHSGHRSVIVIPFSCCMHVHVRKMIASHARILWCLSVLPAALIFMPDIHSIQTNKAAGLTSSARRSNRKRPFTITSTTAYFSAVCPKFLLCILFCPGQPMGKAELLMESSTNAGGPPMKTSTMVLIQSFQMGLKRSNSKDYFVSEFHISTFFMQPSNTSTSTMRASQSTETETLALFVLTYIGTLFPFTCVIGLYRRSPFNDTP